MDQGEKLHVVAARSKSDGSQKGPEEWLVVGRKMPSDAPAPITSPMMAFSPHSCSSVNLLEGTVGVAIKMSHRGAHGNLV